MSDDRVDHPAWRLRAPLLLVLGALAGLLVHNLLSNGDAWSYTEDPLRQAAAAAVVVAGLLLAFTLERLRSAWSIAFALIGGAIVGGIFYWNGDSSAQSADDGWRFFASLLAVAIAAPLFQTVRDEGKWRLPYYPVHSHAWTNIILWSSAWLFVLISWLLLQLLGELFQLIGISLLRDALGQGWFNWMVVGGALGAAVGLLRDRDRVLGLLQRVVTTVLSVLAPVLAAGLLLFVLALPFTGLGVLWDQTSATTPILLGCVIGAILLVNAVIGTGEEEEASNPVVRYSAQVLGAVMTPLVLVAGVSTAIRLNQHGYTPSRLWACVFILIALAFALRYLSSLVRRRLAWASSVRRQNVGLAVGICLVALLLATPLVNFSAISARDQLSRLEAGSISPTEFDWEAMRFDFGRSGVRALMELKERTSNSADIRTRAANALSWQVRGDVPREIRDRGRPQPPLTVRIVPAGPLPPALEQAIRDRYACTAGEACVLLHEAGSNEAILVTTGRCVGNGRTATGRGEAMGMAGCDPQAEALFKSGETWGTGRPTNLSNEQLRTIRQRRAQAVRQGRVEIRTVPRRQLYVDGEPVGEPFE